MTSRQQARHDAGDARAGPGGRGAAVGEDRGLCNELVQIRRRTPVIPVMLEMICPEGVDDAIAALKKVQANAAELREAAQKYRDEHS